MQQAGLDAGAVAAAGAGASAGVGAGGTPTLLRPAKSAVQDAVQDSMLRSAQEARIQRFDLVVEPILTEIELHMRHNAAFSWQPRLDDELLAHLASCSSRRQFCDCLHRKNLNEQQRVPMFRFLTAIRQASQDRAEGAVADALSARIKQATERILSLCTLEFLQGQCPAGENPVHVAFLFGLHAFGLDMIEAAAQKSENPEVTRRSLVQRPYFNDLDPWFQLAEIVPDATSSQAHIRRPESEPSGPSGASANDSENGGRESVKGDKKLDGDEKEMLQLFKDLLYTQFATPEDRRQARMPFNLMDESGLAGRDGGLFTGETLLHLAIVQRSEDAVDWLLEHGAAIDAQAPGIFFQPAQIEQFGKFQERSWLSDVRALLIDAGSQREKNSFGGACYYGEFPLSFAATIGDKEICHMLGCKARDLLLLALKALHDSDGEKDNEVAAETSTDRGFPFRAENAMSFKMLKAVDSELHLPLHTVDATRFLASLYCAEDVQVPDSSRDANSSVSKEMERLKAVWMNRSDTRGNTALHMAVQHKQHETIDWLLENGASPSMLVLNEDNFTPLTLSVRNGDPQLFQHLTKRLQINVWSFGSAQMIVAPLEQLDTFVIASAPETKMKKRHRRNILSSAAQRTKAFVVSAADKTKEAALGVAHLAQDTVLGVTDGVRGITRAAGGSLTRALTRRAFNLDSHQEFLSTLVADIQETVVGLSTALDDGSKLHLKPPGGAQSRSIQDLHSDPNFRGALEIVVHHEIYSFFDVPIFKYLIDDKWAKFARKLHIQRVLLYTFFVMVTTFALDHRARSIRREAFSLQDEPESEIYCFMFWTCPRSSEMPIQICFDVSLYILGMPYMLIQAWRNRRISLHDFDPNSDLDLSMTELMFFIYKNLHSILCISTVALLAGAITDRTRDGINNFMDASVGKDTERGFTELQALSLVTLIQYCNLLHLMLPFEFLGRVLIIIWRMLLGNVAKWVWIYALLLLGFSQAVLIAVQDAVILDPTRVQANSTMLDRLDTGPAGINIASSSLNTFDFVKYYILATVGDVSQASVWEIGITYIWVIHVLFLLLSTVLLLNLIIAMMSETYAAEVSNEGAAMWWMLKAYRVLDLERQLSREHQIEYRSGEDPFTSTTHKEMVPYYHVVVSTQDEEENPRIQNQNPNGSSDVRSLHDLSKKIDTRLRYLDKNSMERIEIVEQHLMDLSGKFDSLLTAINVSAGRISPTAGAQELADNGDARVSTHQSTFGAQGSFKMKRRKSMTALTGSVRMANSAAGSRSTVAPPDRQEMVTHWSRQESFAAQDRQGSGIDADSVDGLNDTGPLPTLPNIPEVQDTGGSFVRRSLKPFPSAIPPMGGTGKGAL